MKPLRTAIIGCGLYGREHAARLVQLPTVKLVAFYDHKHENAAAYRQQFGGGQTYTDHERMFAEMDLNLVYICLPPFAHGNEVELACKHGVHFLIEKPIALTLEQANAMAAQVQASGVKTQVGFKFRHGEAALWLKPYLREANVGGRAFMMARYACNSLHRPWWRDRSKSGGQLLEQIIHILDLARYFLGEPVRVFSMQDNFFHREVADYTIEDASATVIRFASGAMAVVAATNGAIPNRWDYDWRIVLPHITADFTDASHATIHHTDQTPPTTTTIAADKDVLLAQTLDLLAAIRDNRSTVAPIEEGVRSLSLALAAVRSAEQDMPIALATDEQG